MTEQELQKIVHEELEGRPIFAPANVKGCLDSYYRDLQFLPAREVRLAIRSFYAAPVCQRCATRSNRWPHVEEIRAQMPEAVIARAAKDRTAGDCLLCDGTGWVETARGAVRCKCRRAA